MTDYRRSDGSSVPRLQKQHSLRGHAGNGNGVHDAIELKKYQTAFNNSTNSTGGGNGGGGGAMNGHYSLQRNPLLQAHSDQSSTTSSTATTTATAATTGRSNCNDAGVGGGGGGLEMQFDEHEIFYVSPSKRKANDGDGSGLITGIGMRHLRSFSPTMATVAPSYPSIRPVNAYEQNSFDSYEISSHYSDTAMQVLRSGSCSGVGGIIGSSNLVTAAGGGGGGGGSSSNSSLTAPQQQQPRQQNNVTFSNYVSEQRVGTHHPHPHHQSQSQNQSQGQSQSQNHHRGSLKRHKGRSNQSLCSCDVGDDAEINPDPARPLYEYSLERRRKTHTYTCEQNAQILMRLERERNRKLSLTSVGNGKDDVQSDTPSSEVDVIPPVPPPPSLKHTGSMRSLRLLQLQQQQQQGNNSNNNNNGSTTIGGLCSSGDLLQDCTKHALDVSSGVIDDCATSILKCANVVGNEIRATAANGNCNNNNNNNSTSYTHTKTNSTKPSHGMLSTSTSSSAVTNAKPDVCQQQQQQTQLDNNIVGLPYYPNSQPQPHPPPLQLASLMHNDDICTPHSKKSDPSLCFLHTGGAGGGVVGPLPDLTKSQRDLKQTLSGAATLSLSKYNTIGPSSDYARHLAHYSRYLQKQHQQQQLQHMQQQRCRCFSQSLSSFPRDYFGRNRGGGGSSGGDATNARSLSAEREGNDNQHKHATNNGSGNIFHTGGGGGGGCMAVDDWFNNAISGGGGGGGGSIGLLPINSRSYSNLVDIDGQHSRLGIGIGIGSCRLPYQKFNAPATNTIGGSMLGIPATATAATTTTATTIGGNTGSNCSFGGNLANAISTFTMTSLDSTNSGLKEKYEHQQQQLQLQQLQLQQQHHQHHHHHLHHPQQQQHHHQHHHAQQQPASQLPPQKHHQLHSSVTSIMPWKHRQCPSRGSSSSGTNSFRFDAAKHWLAVSSILLIIGAASVAVPLALRVAASAPFEERLRVAVQLLDQVPLIDGHNDLPWNIRKFLHNKLNDFNFDEDLRNVMPWARSHWSHTDLQRLKKGRISAQFWAAYVPCEAQHRDAVQLTLEQIDVIKRLTDRYSPQLTTCTSAQDIIEAHKNHQLCSLTGVEGGHSLGGSLAVLRTLYAIGVRYMTLTSTCHTPWADSSYADAPTFNMKHGGLTIFGKTIIREMNRLGMMVDLSHVSKGTMRDSLEVSEAPVIFSHSSAYELCNTSRNVQDDILQALAKNGGLVMVNFYSKFLSCSENSTVHDAVAHINHIKRVAGIDHVGLGAGYDGINYTPKGLEDVSSYPTLFAELLGAGWSIEDLTKLAGGNFLRVMQQVEKIRDEKRAAGVKPYEDHPNFRTDDPYNCTSS